MKGPQGVILIMVAALVLWFTWSSNSPFRQTASAASGSKDKPTGSLDTPAGPVGGTANDVAIACTNVDADTRRAIRAFYVQRVVSWGFPMPIPAERIAQIASEAVQKFPNVSVDCLRAIANNMENAK